MKGKIYARSQVAFKLFMSLTIVVVVLAIWLIATTVRIKDDNGHINNGSMGVERTKKKVGPKNYKAIAKDTALAEFNVEKWYRNNGKDKVLTEIMSKYGHAIKMTSERVGIDYKDYVPVAVIESSGDINIIGEAGEKCFSQLKQVAIRAVEKRFNVTIKDPFNAWDCSYGGAGYLKIQLELHDGNLPLAYVGYNNGEGFVKKKRSAGINPATISHYDDKAAYIRKQIEVMKF